MVIETLTSIGIESAAPSLLLEHVEQSIDGTVDAAALFARLTGNGTHSGCILLESGEQGPRYAERSIGVVASALMVRAKGRRAEIVALDGVGGTLLPRVLERLPRGVEVIAAPGERLECLLPVRREVPASFEERLCSSLHTAVLRAALPEDSTDEGRPTPPWGLYGAFSYDFVQHFEELPAATADPLDEPDYIFYLPSQLFVVDHRRGTTCFACLTTTSENATDAAACRLAAMRRASLPIQAAPSPAVRFGELVSDTSFDQYCAAVEQVKRAVARGDIYQAVIGRMLSAPFEGDPFAVYRTLKRCNPSPFLFYLRDDRGVLLGASPELAVRVGREDSRRTVEIRPIAGTRPRGLREGRVDAELDARLEVSLKIDTKELAEHVMLIDLARNDVAAVSLPGTTRVEAALEVEKYSHVQHLVSRVRGELRGDFDALDVYVATMNMGTLTGAPKLQAMRLIAELETAARGFFGGAVGFLTSRGELETAIVIRALRVLDGKVFLRAGAGIVADSVADSEWLETQRKMEACIQALREASDGD